MEGTCEFSIKSELEPLFSEERAMLTRDELIRDARSRAGTLPAVLIVYAVLVGTMVAAGLSMT